MPKRHTLENSDYFKIINTATKAYFVGFIAADGCIQQLTRSSMGLSITLKSCDIEILTKLKAELGCSNPIRVYTRPQSFDKSVITEFCRLQIVDCCIIDSLLKLGLTQRKSLTLCNFINKLPKKWRKYAVLGYFDGDGGFILPKGKIKTHKAGDKYQVNSCSIQIMIRGTYKVLQGIIETMSFKQFNLAQYDATPRLAVNRKEEVIKLIDIYKTAPFFLKRKWEKIQDRLSTWTIP